MIRTTKKQAAISTVATPISEEFRRTTRFSAKPVEHPLAMEPAHQTRPWLENVVACVWLCLVTAVVVTATGLLAREIFNQLLRYTSLELMRGFSGM